MLGFRTMARVPTFALYAGMGAVFLGLYLAGSSRAPSPPPGPPPPPPPLPPPTSPPGTPRVPQRGAFHFSPASLRNMGDPVHPEMVAVATRALELGPLDFAVTSGMRSTEEQQRLFDEGFSDCNPSAGCVGKHTTGRALDLAPIFDGKAELHSKARVRQLAPQVKAAAAELGVPLKWLGEPDSGFDDPFHWQLAASVGAPNVEGYRRAQQAEVTPYMTAQAQAALAHRLGDVRGPFVNERGELFKVRLEVHSNAPKGASVFLRKSLPVA